MGWQGSGGRLKWLCTLSILCKDSQIKLALGISSEHSVEPLAETTGRKQKAMVSRVAEFPWRELAVRRVLAPRPFGSRICSPHRRHHHDRGHLGNFKLSVY